MKSTVHTQNGIQMWHGAMRWEPPFEVRPPKGGRAEHGAGLYLCCRRHTAIGYAKGGGNLVHTVVDEKVRWLEDISVPADLLLDAARRIPRLRQRESIMSDIERAALRHGGALGLNVLTNLAVNHDAMVGQPAVDISRFMVEQGADASLYERPSGDDWVVIFNPKVLLQARVVRIADAGNLPHDFPRVREQLQALKTASAETQSPLHAAAEPARAARLRPRP
jgi:hypothetical protein